MAKRGINIYKRKDGRWEGRYIQGRKISGDAKYGYVYGHSYSECREKLKAAEVQNKSSPKCKCTLTVKELFSLLLRDRAGEVKESTLARYRFLINRHILPSLGDIPANHLTADRLQMFLDEKRRSGGLRGGGLSAKSVRDIYVLIRSALRLASGTFASLQEPPHIKLPPCRQRRIQVFSDSEVQRIAAHAVAVSTLGSLGILLGLNTGLRLGELCALRWSDVDFFSGTIRVERTVQRVNYGGSTRLLLQSPKSESSMRSVPVPADMLDLLKKKASGSAREADVLCFAGHKTLMGPFGIGGFLIKHGITLKKVLTGGTGSASLTLDMPEEAPGRYEASSTNVVAIAGLNASLKGLDINEHRKTLRELTEYLLEALNGIPSVNLMGTFDTDKTLGIVSFVVEGYQSDEVGIILDDEYDIAVRTGYHCAPYIHDYLGDKPYHGTIRIGIGQFNTKEDIDALISAIKSL